MEEGVYTCIGENFGEVGGIQLLDGVYLPSLVVPKLLYSAAGISRSSTMVIAYLMTVSTLTAEEALCVVRYCRKIANPNYGFMKQLKEYEETTLARVSGQGSMVKSTFKTPPLLSDHRRRGYESERKGVYRRTKNSSELFYPKLNVL